MGGRQFRHNGKDIGLNWVSLEDPWLLSIVFPLTFQEHTVVSRFVYKLQEDSKRIELALVVVWKDNVKVFSSSFHWQVGSMSSPLQYGLWDNMTIQNTVEAMLCQFLGRGLKRLPVPLSWTPTLGPQSPLCEKTRTGIEATSLCAGWQSKVRSQLRASITWVRNPHDASSCSSHLNCNHTGDQSTNNPSNQET